VSTICPHSFVAYVDKNLKIRDYFVPDFQLELTETESTKKIEEITIPGLDLIDLDLLKLNLASELLCCMLGGIFLKRKLLLILEEEYLYNHIQNFFQYITQDSFEYEIKIVSTEEYNNNRDKYEDYIVLKGTEIFNDKENVLNLKKLIFEKIIIEKFLSESQSSISLVLLKNEIKKNYVLSKSISEFINDYKNKEKLSSKIITDYLKDAHGYKVQKDFKKYLNFLLEIVENYFNIQLYESSDVADFLEFI
ncbi:MAG: hypothetical protein ACFFAO_21225, partial [Candidatus Hermodarchaeota archaeon]